MIATNEKSTLKKKMLEACINKQKNLIDDFKARIKALLENGPFGNEEEYDNNLISQKAQINDEINALSQALNFANEEMKALDALKSGLNESHTHVGPGTVVVTQLSTFFVSVSIEQFQVEEETFIGVSSGSPLFKVMKGKKKGQSFTCNGITYEIIDVF